MKNKNPFRKQLGFSQYVYSSYLGISKGLLSLVELNLRPLRQEARSKNDQLQMRWLAFEKEYIPPPPDQQSIIDTKKALKKKLDILKSRKTKREIQKEKKDEQAIDYQKANAFLQQELNQNEQADDVLYLDLTKRHNKKRITKNPLLNAVEESLQDRFLDFQIAEYEKSLLYLKNRLIKA
jgi:hypothetical protein